MPNNFFWHVTIFRGFTYTFSGVPNANKQLYLFACRSMVCNVKREPVVPTAVVAKVPSTQVDLGMPIDCFEIQKNPSAPSSCSCNVSTVPLGM